MLPWKPNKMAMKCTVCEENHQMIITAKYDYITSLVMKKMQFSHFPLKVYGSFLLPWQPNQEADHQSFSYFELSLPKQHLYKIRVILLQ